jgi:hypothetical protein
MDIHCDDPVCEWLALACVQGESTFGLSVGVLPAVWLVDTRALGKWAWDSVFDSHWCLSEVFKHPEVYKAMWDARYDVHVLCRAYGIALCADTVLDLQLAYMFSLKQPRVYLAPLGTKVLVDLLAKCPRFTKHAEALRAIEVNAKAIWRERDGGEIGAWRRRPTEHVLLQYACVDVAYLHDVAWVLRGSLCAPEVVEHTYNRVELGLTTPKWGDLCAASMAKSPSLNWTFLYSARIKVDLV